MASVYSSFGGRSRHKAVGPSLGTNSRIDVTAIGPSRDDHSLGNYISSHHSSGNKCSSERRQNIFKVYIRRIPYSVTEDQLRKCFSQVGPVERVRIIQPSTNYGDSLPFGFVWCYSLKDAERAVNTMNATLLNGIKIDVELTKETKTIVKTQGCNRDSEMSTQHPFPAVSSKGGLPSLYEYEDSTEPSVTCAIKSKSCDTANSHQKLGMFSLSSKPCAPKNTFTQSSATDTDTLTLKTEHHKPILGFKSKMLQRLSTRLHVPQRGSHFETCNVGPFTSTELTTNSHNITSSKKIIEAPSESHTECAIESIHRNCHDNEPVMSSESSEVCMQTVASVCEEPCRPELSADSDVSVCFKSKMLQRLSTRLHVPQQGSHIETRNIGPFASSTELTTNSHNITSSKKIEAPNESRAIRSFDVTESAIDSVSRTCRDNEPVMSSEPSEVCMQTVASVCEESCRPADSDVEENSQPDNVNVFGRNCSDIEQEIASLQRSTRHYQTEIKRLQQKNLSIGKEVDDRHLEQVAEVNGVIKLTSDKLQAFDVLLKLESHLLTKRELIKRSSAHLELVLNISRQKYTDKLMQLELELTLENSKVKQKLELLKLENELLKLKNEFYIGIDS